MARSKEDLARKIGADGMRAVGRMLGTIFAAFDDGKISFFEGFAMGSSATSAFVVLHPLIQEAREADWDEHDIEPLLEALATQLEQG